MNRAISRVFLVGAILFAALIVNLTWIQVFHARALRDNPANFRAVVQELKIKRGKIVSFDGTVLADVERHSGFYYRSYPQGSIAAQTIGYDSVEYGRSGIEAEMNDVLVGRSGAETVQTLWERLLGRRPVGSDVRLTLVRPVQTVAEQALVGKVGAIVALNPKTGAVLAMASSPTYSLKTIDKAWADLSSDPAAPLFDRPVQSKYPPGSSFKVVTAAAGLATGTVTPTTMFTDTGTYVPYGGKVTNYHGEVMGRIDFTRALTLSINTVFARVGVEVGQDKLVKTMRDFGFWESPPLDLPDSMVVASGRYEKDVIISPDAQLNDLQLAWMACGQDQLVASPLQMALVTAAVANGGTIMEPHLVYQVVSAKGDVVQDAVSREWRTAMDPATATTLNLIMQKVVSEGTGTAAAIAGVKVAGKTGTAETGKPTDQAWFVGFAPADDPTVVVCVSIENSTSTGGAVAAPIAADVMRAALAQASLP